MYLTSKQVPLEFKGNPTKFKKYHKIKIKKSIKTCKVVKNNFTFILKDIDYLPQKRLASVLKIIKPGMKSVSRSCKLDIHSWPTILLTKKPKDIRMGRGKGPATERVAIAGKTKLFVLHSLNNIQALNIYKKCEPKIIHSKFINYSKW